MELRLCVSDPSMCDPSHQIGVVVTQGKNCSLFSLEGMTVMGQIVIRSAILELFQQKPCVNLYRA